MKDKSLYSSVLLKLPAPKFLVFYNGTGRVADREGILSEFLSRNRAEVLKMSIFEYDQELEEKKYREAEYEHGMQEGYDAGIKEGRTAGMQEGRAAGIQEGRAAGIREGMETGRIAALRSVVKNLAKQNIPLQQIAEAAGVDEATVRKWITEEKDTENE